MGFDIQVVTLAFDPASHTAVVTETLCVWYWSYNWSDYAQYWYVRDHMFGHSRAAALAYLDQAIQRLEAEGVCAAEPDPRNPNWSWGVKKVADGQTEQYPDAERRAIFLHHLQGFRTDVEALAAEEDVFFLDEDYQSETTAVLWNGVNYLIGSVHADTPDGQSP